MTIILRLPAILVLFALVAMSWMGAAVGAAAITNTPISVPGLGQETVGEIAQATWLDVGLWAGAGLFFLISAIRLIRRTQAFWAWLLGFACYGARWALAQQSSEGGVLATVQGVDLNAYMQPAALAGSPDSVESQLGLLGVVLIVGLIVFVIDAFDRAHWNKQGA